MSLRKALASALQRLRRERGMAQADFVDSVTQSHVSLLEAAKTSLSTDTLDDLCRSLRIQPVTFLAVMYAAHLQRSPAEVLALARDELDELGLTDLTIAQEPEAISHPRVSRAAQARQAVQELKASGMSQADIARALNMAESTVRRHWHREDV